MHWFRPKQRPSQQEPLLVAIAPLLVTAITEERLLDATSTLVRRTLKNAARSGLVEEQRLPPYRGLFYSLTSKGALALSLRPSDPYKSLRDFRKAEAASKAIARRIQLAAQIELARFELQQLDKEHPPLHGGQVGVDDEESNG